VEGATGPTGPQGATGPRSPQRFIYYANDYENPVTSDWGAPTLAPAAPDTILSSLVIRGFDDTIEEGVGFYLTVPSGSAGTSIEIKARAQTAPTQIRLAGNSLYFRQIPDATGPVPTWNKIILNNHTMASGMTSYQYKPRQDIPLSGNGGFSPGVTPGSLYQFEISRTSPTLAGGGATNLSGDWNLVEFIIEFA
jgi:hypothetical protein